MTSPVRPLLRAYDDEISRLVDDQEDAARFRKIRELADQAVRVRRLYAESRLAAHDEDDICTHVLNGDNHQEGDRVLSLLWYLPSFYGDVRMVEIEKKLVRVSWEKLTGTCATCTRVRSK